MIFQTKDIISLVYFDQVTPIVVYFAQVTPIVVYFAQVTPILVHFDQVTPIVVHYAEVTPIVVYFDQVTPMVLLDYEYNISYLLSALTISQPTTLTTASLGNVSQL